MEIIEQQYQVPDGKGSYTIRHFETSDNVVKMSDGKTLKEKFNALLEKVRAIQAEKITPSANEIKGILNGSYVPTGSDGTGEFNGVPTRAEIKAILKGNYTHTDKKLDEFATKDVITKDEIKKILNGTY